MYDPSCTSTKEMLILLKKVPTASNTTNSSRVVDVKLKAINLLMAVLENSEVEVENNVNATAVESTTTRMIPPKMEVEQLQQNPSKVIKIEDSKKK